MPRISIPLLAAAAFSFATAAIGATDERLTTAETDKLNTCMAMPREALDKDTGCNDVLRKASITKADVEKMRRCEGKIGGEVSKDPDCVAMIKKHPDLVRGHGSLVPEEQKSAPAPK